METVTQKTLRSGAIGAVVGIAVGFVPLILLVAPLLGGSVAGYVERDGPRRGAIAGAVAGVLMAAFSTILTGTILFFRFGELPFADLSDPFSGLLFASFLSLIATIGQVIVSAIGGALGGVLEADRHRAAVQSGPGGEAKPGRSLGVIVGSIVAGIVVFGVVTVALTVVLDPLIWLSVLVSIPIGFVAGAAVAVLGYHFLTREPAERVNWRSIGLGVLAVVVVFGLVLAGLSALGQERIDESSQSTYEYRVTIAADETLETPTFYVPAPVEDNSSRLGELFVEQVQYDRYVPAMEGADPNPEPVNFTYRLVETEHGPMIAISAEQIEVQQYYYRDVENETMGYRERIDPEEYDPDDPSMGVQDDGSFTFMVSVAANDSIDTATPFGDEPLLSARDNLTETECFRQRSDTQHCYTYEGRVFASYDTAPETTVYVGTELNGRNEWFSGGWTGNEYREWSRTEMVGPRDGWYRTDGELEIGSGNYRE